MDQIMECELCFLIFLLILDSVSVSVSVFISGIWILDSMFKGCRIITSLFHRKAM